jgi:hypothetical protein
MVQTVSVKEIAQRVRGPNESLQTAIDRVRNWTKEGLIKTAGEAHPGKGRARQYDEWAMIDAALLQVLTECTGMPAVKVEPMLGAAREHLMKNWPRTKRTLLVIGQSRDGNFTISGGSIEKLATYLNASPQDTYTLIDLKRLVDSSLLTKD